MSSGGCIGEVKHLAEPALHVNRRPVADDVHAGQPAAGRRREAVQHRADFAHRQQSRIPVHDRFVGREHVLVERNVQRPIRQLLAVGPQQFFNAIPARMFGRRRAQRFVFERPPRRRDGSGGRRGKA